MPRRKMTEEEKAERRERMDAKKRTEQEVSRRANELERLRYNAARQIEPTFRDPTRSFKVGDMVHFGNHDNAKVIEVSDDGFYLIHVWGVHDVYTKKNVPYETWHWEAWYDLLPVETARNTDQPRLSFRDDIDLQFMQQDIHSILGYHRQGIDYAPEYQRGHAWSLEQRVALIDSIFQNADIGKFTFIDRGYLKEGPMLEILDGKQRLSTIVAFFQERFRYKGLYYSEMHPRDRVHFKSHRVSVAMTERMTEAQKYRYFLRLNITGEPQDPNHIAHVQYLLKTAEDKEK